jgi:hypothetical protein
MSQVARPAFVLGPGEGRSIDLGNFAMVVKATADDTGTAFSLLEAAEPAGFGPPMHVHHNTAEAFYVLAGEYVIFLDDRELRPAHIWNAADRFAGKVCRRSTWNDRGRRRQTFNRQGAVIGRWRRGDWKAAHDHPERLAGNHRIWCVDDFDKAS